MRCRLRQCSTKCATPSLRPSTGRGAYYLLSLDSGGDLPISPLHNREFAAKLIGDIGPLASLPPAGPDYNAKKAQEVSGMSGMSGTRSLRAAWGWRVDGDGVVQLLGWGKIWTVEGKGLSTYKAHIRLHVCLVNTKPQPTRSVAFVPLLARTRNDFTHTSTRPPLSSSFIIGTPHSSPPSPPLSLPLMCAGVGGHAGGPAGSHG